mgnify:CR=1 FL=1
MRQYRPTAVPQTGINHELLQAELAVLGDIGVSKDASDWVIDIFVEGLTDSAIQAVINAHDASVKTSSQERAEQKEILFNQVNARFLQEVVKASPDWLSAYTDIASMVASNTPVLNALNNIIDLQNDVYQPTGITAGDNRAKQQQLLAFIQVLSLWATAV